MPHSIDLLSYITLIGTSTGIYLGFLLLFIKSAKNNANIYLACLVWLMMWVMLPHFFQLFGLLETFPHIILSRVLTTLIGPLFYFYVRACTQKNFTFTPILLLHFVPFLINLGYNFPFLLQAGETKIATYLYLNKSGSNSDLIMPVLRAIYNFIYFVAGARLTLRYKKHLTNTTSHIENTYSNWLLGISSALLIPVLTFLIYAFAEDRADVMLPLFSTLSFFLFAILTIALIKPSVFHTFPHQIAEPEMALTDKKKYEQSGLDDQKKEQYLATLLHFMDTKKPFQQPDLTLNQLSEQVEIPYYYLSQIINEKLNVNFIDFINNYRIEAAKKMLTSTQYQQYTIVAIAHAAGFNSRSAFYYTFKRLTKKTPSQFRK